MSRVWVLLPAAVLAAVATGLAWLFHWLVLEDLEAERMGLDKALSNLQQELQAQLADNAGRRSRLTLTGWAESAWFPGAGHSSEKEPASPLQGVMYMADRQGLKLHSVMPMRSEEPEIQTGEKPGLTHTEIIRPSESMLVLGLLGSLAQTASFLAMYSGADAVGAQTAVLHHLHYARDISGASTRAGRWQLVMEFAPLASDRMVPDTAIVDSHDPRSAGALRRGVQGWHLLVDAEGQWQLSPLYNKNVDHRDDANEVR